MRVLMLFAPTLIVVIVVLVTTSIALAVQERGIRETTSERVLSVASSLAELPQVRQELALVHTDVVQVAAELQPLASVIEQAAGVDYVVISDENGIRVTHPRPSERGKHVSTDNATVLAGETFLGVETGTIGRTLRAKVPVLDANDEVIGALSVGILESRIVADRDEALERMLPWALGSLIIGALASALVAATLGRRFRLLDAAAREHETLKRTSAALHEQSHEFVTRLHVIHGLVSHGDAREALQYIEGLSSVSSEAGFDDGDLQPLLRATLDALRAEIGSHGARLETDIDVASEVDDDVRLVVTNLGRNAAEANASVVQFTLIERDGKFFGEVSDDGDGIDLEHLDRVFSRGFSTKDAFAQRGGTAAGRGIGLDLVRRAVAARGGSIEVGSSPLGGSRMRFDMEVR